MYKTLALALAAVASAMPAPQSGSANGAHPEKSQEFGLVMDVDGSKVALTAVSNGTVGNKVLQAGRLSVYTGSPGTIPAMMPVIVGILELTTSSLLQLHRWSGEQGFELAP